MFVHCETRKDFIFLTKKARDVGPKNRESGAENIVNRL
jgi:hypothetical protein